MFKVQVLIYVDDASGKHVDYYWEDYSGFSYGCELDAMDEYTEARLKGYTARIKEEVR